MAKTEIDISVALAAYRGGKFFEQQLISLAEQTRIPDEVVITDDGGKLATEQTVNNSRHSLQKGISVPSRRGNATACAPTRFMRKEMFSSVRPSMGFHP